MSSDEELLEESGRAAAELLMHLRRCDDCLREIVRHLYADERVLGHTITLCAIGAPLMEASAQAYATYRASLTGEGSSR